MFCMPSSQEIFHFNKFHDLILQNKKKLHSVIPLGVNDLEIMIAAGKAIKSLILFFFGY